MTLLQQFQNDLEKLIGNPTDLRPFVCEGSPLDCKIFIVGFNPATALKHSFWSFWQPEYGFQKTEWLKVYKQERRDKPLSLGKKRRKEVSNTRRVIEWIIAEAKPMKCLETNIYAMPTEQARDLREQERVTRPFDFLLRAIRPQVMLLHGQDAVKHLETIFDVQLKMDSLQSIEVEWGEVKVLAVSHFSRGWSKNRAREIGQILRTTKCV
jgi:hypothetical protein